MQEGVLCIRQLKIGLVKVLNFVWFEVHYTDGMLSKLSAQFKALSVEDRIGLISDSYALAKAGIASPSGVVRLLAGTVGESSSKVQHGIYA